MKSYNLLLAVALSVALIGCEKDDKTSPATTTTSTTSNTPRPVTTTTTSSSTTSSSTTTSTTDCQTDASKRRGAKCKDGSESTATGSGACSKHGGVAYWLCK